MFCCDINFKSFLMTFFVFFYKYIVFLKKLRIIVKFFKFLWIFVPPSSSLPSFSPPPLSLLSLPSLPLLPLPLPFSFSLLFHSFLSIPPSPPCAFLFVPLDPSRPIPCYLSCLSFHPLSYYKLFSVHPMPFFCFSPSHQCSYYHCVVLPT